jgi:hypothetical protein
MMRRFLLTGVILHLSVMSGCSAWTQDVQNKLPSDSSAPPPAATPTQLGFISDDAAPMAGPVLVIPSASGAYHYRFYQAGENHCTEDVQKLMASRAAYPTNDPAPYCSDKPTEPAAKTGSFMGF